MSNFNALSISNQNGKTLTPEQLAFNKINEKISRQAEKFEADKSKFEQILQFFNEKIKPSQVEVAREKMNIALFLHEVSATMKLTKKQNEQVGDAIIYLLDKGFEFHEPTAEEKSIYDFWSPQTYDEIEEEQIEFQKRQLKFMMQNMGIDDIDLDDFDPNDPEKMAEMAGKFKEAQENKKESNENAGARKSKRQKQKEEEEKAMQAIQKKSLREIYISLAKVFHPDSSDTTVDSSQKEEIMKQVTNAYEAGDLPTLLKIEAEWIAKQENDINKLGSDKLKVYINLLKKRLEDMEQDYMAMRHHPRFGPVHDFMGLSLPNADKKLSRIHKEFKSILSEIQLDMLRLKTKGDKNDILGLTRALVDAKEREESNGFFDFL